MTLSIPDNTSFSGATVNIQSLTMSGGGSISATNQLAVTTINLTNDSTIEVQGNSSTLGMAAIETGTIDHSNVSVSGGTTTGELFLAANHANEALTIGNGADVEGVTLFIGGFGGSTVTVTGAATRVTGDTTHVLDTLSVLQGANASLGKTSVSGLLDIESGGQVTSDDASLSDHGGNLLNLTGQNSQWTVGGDLKINFGQGSVTGGAVLHVLGGGALDIADAASTNTINSIASLAFNGASTRLDAAGDVTVGGEGAGTLSFTTGASGNIGGALVLGDKATGTGTLSLDGQNVSLAVTGDATVGNEGVGTATLANGASLTTGDLTIGSTAPADGGAVDPDTGLHTQNVSSLSIDGGGQVQTGDLKVGDQGYGALSIHDATVTTSGDAAVGDGDGGEGEVTLDNENARWTTGGLTVGGSGTGVLNISNGMITTNGDGAIGDTDGGTGTVDVDGAASSWSIAGGLTVGGGGTGTLTLENGSTVTVNGSELVLGDQASGDGHVTIDGGDTKLVFADANAVSDEMTVGKDGTGVFALQDGANFATHSITAGDSQSGTGTINVLGDSSKLEVLSDFVLGSGGHGALSVDQQAKIQADGDLTLSDKSTGGGTITLDHGASLLVGGTLSIGHMAQASLTIQGGASAEAIGDKVELGESDGGAGVLTLTGTDTPSNNSTPSSFKAVGDVLVGDAGAGEIDIAQGAVMQPDTGGTGVVELGVQALSQGTVRVSDAGSLFEATTLTLGGTATAAGGTGLLALTGGGSADIGANLDSWDGATVTVDSSSTASIGAVSNAAAGAVTVGSGGALTGTGDYQADLINFGSVRVGHAASGTLTVSGAYSQGAAGTLTFEVGPTGAGEMVVGGAARLNGVLNLVYDPGTYSAKDYTLISAGSIAGTFSSVTGTGPTGLTQAIDYSQTKVVLDLSGQSGTVGGGGSGGGSSGGSGGGTLSGGVPNLSGSGDATIDPGGASVGGDGTSTTYTGVLSGDGGLTKVGAGELVLDGAETYTGPTEISGGALQVGDSDHPGASIDSPVTVDDGGVLSGHGTVNGDVSNNGGVVQPGGTIGVLTVTGAYTQSASGVLAIEVSPAGASELNVTGAASLNGALHLVYDPGVYRPANYTIVSAASRTGTFSTVTGSVPTSGLSQAVDYTPTGVVLDLSGPVVVAPTNDAILASPASLAIAEAEDAQATILDHLGDRSPVLGAVGGDALAVTNGAPGGQGGLNDALGQLPGMAARSGGWIAASGELFAINNNAVSPGFHAAGGGILAGLDRAVGDSARIGVAGGYSRMNLDQSSGGKGVLETGRAAIYGGMTVGVADVRALVGYAHIDITTDRPVADIGAAGEGHGADEVDAAVQARTTSRYGGYVIMPSLGLNFTHISEGGFRETGALGFDLVGSAHATDSLQPQAGISVRRDAELALGLILSTTLRASYAYEVLDDRRRLTVAAQDGTAFDDEGLRPTRGFVRFGVGVALKKGDRLRFHLDYDTTAPTANVSDQAFSAGLAWRF